MSQQSTFAAPCSRADLRAYANQIRRMFKLEKEKCFPIIQFIEWILPEVYSDFVFEIREIGQMGDRHGQAYPDKNTIILREDVYEGVINGQGRDRFTLAHELGHFLLHRDGAITMARMKPGAKIPPYRDPEWQANAFAGELLMPVHIITGMTPLMVSKECRVTIQAAIVQLNKI